MKVSEKIIGIIKEPSVRRKLAEALDCTDQTVVRYIKDNESNGDLTKAAALKVMAEETGLSQEELLEDEKVSENTN